MLHHDWVSYIINVPPHKPGSSIHEWWLETVIRGNPTGLSSTECSFSLLKTFLEFIVPGKNTYVHKLRKNSFFLYLPVINLLIKPTADNVKVDRGFQLLGGLRSRGNIQSGLNKCTLFKFVMVGSRKWIVQWKSRNLGRSTIKQQWHSLFHPWPKTRTENHQILCYKTQLLDGQATRRKAWRFFTN